MNVMIRGRVARAKLVCGGLLAAATVFFAFAGTQSASGSPVPDEASPIFGVTIPKGYRQWQAIAPSEESPPLDELRLILGNPTAMKAFSGATLPFPDGTILAKLAWKRVQSTESPPAFVPGQSTTVQIMVKDSKRYASTGGWGFGRFIDGKPVDEAQHRTCFACHQARVVNHDYVFTRLAP
jgi:Cytochrome P460